MTLAYAFWSGSLVGVVIAYLLLLAGAALALRRRR